MKTDFNDDLFHESDAFHFGPFLHPLSLTNMDVKNRDVLRELDDARSAHEELARAREAYEASRMSRVGNIVALWAAAKAALAPRRRETPIYFLTPAESERPSALGQSLWQREAQDAAATEIHRLHGEIAKLGRALEDSRVMIDATAAERDADRATHFRLRAGLANAQADLTSTRAVLAEVQTNHEAAVASARDLAAERDALRKQAATLERKLEQLEFANAKPTLQSPTIPIEPKIAEKRDILERILRGSRAFLDTATPDVSVIIPAYDQLAMTLDCLISVALCAEDGPTMQIIVVDDASPNEPVCAVISGLPFITSLRNGSNRGFLRSCNTASALATGRYIHFLNNDTLVRTGWLSELVKCADADETIGAVGSRLLFADGSLQEAGGIIWRDASGWNYGRSDDPESPKYNYTRDVDYLSGASLLVRTDLFRRLGCFDDRYAPAYFEDSDLCFAIRQAGMRVVYQPKSTIVHLEGVSSGTSTDAGVKQHQVLNKPKFVKKWSEALERHFVPGAVSGLRAARRLQKPRTLVMIDNYVPEYDKDSGSNKLFNFIQLYGELGYNVIYVPDNYHRSEPYTATLQNLGVEVLYGTANGETLQAALRERLEIADVVWMGRPELGDRYLPIVREFPHLPVLYDTHDLHYVRVRRELELKGIDDPEKWHEWELLREQELRVVRDCDIAMTVTDVEKRVLEDAGIHHVFVMPNVHESYGRKTPYEQTSGIIFIGGYVHGPNVDAVVWLCNEIMPIVWQTHPDITVTLIGSNAPPAVHALANERVIVAGFIHDVEPYFEAARLMVAPLRYGAGLKGKIGHAFAYELPVVTTPIGAEGFDINNGRDALVEESADGIACAIVRAYDDRKLWQMLSTGGAQLVKRFSPAATRDRLAAATKLAFERRAIALGKAR
jgi:GT2 family glycosyltransferase